MPPQAPEELFRVGRVNGNKRRIEERKEQLQQNVSKLKQLYKELLLGKVNRLERHEKLPKYLHWRSV